MNIVLDTNTVISGIFWKGAPRQVLDLARSGTFRFLQSLTCLQNWLMCLGGKNSLQGWNKPIQVLTNWFSVMLRWQRQCARSRSKQ
jgi:predicted nucleic acid-binding protein